MPRIPVTVERVSLDDAKAALLRDAAAYAGLVDEAADARRWWLQEWPAGAPYLLCLLAQDVQEAVHALDPLWPLCPEHRDHPLFVEPDLGPDPFWVCHRTGLPVAAVGSLL
ncbi:MAG: hypothetical protein JWN77_2149 [Frankiales bacterium]|nr:hypothetical protein [Frankiales bacterium]